jgi:hypothetical protein
MTDKPVFKGVPVERRLFCQTWLALLGFVSVGSTTKMTDIFVCRQHVANVGLTRQQLSVMLANILAVSVMLGNFVADTFSYT